MLKIINGDSEASLKQLPDNSVHCVVTSPPYWRLRDYNVAGQIGMEATPGEYLEKIIAVFKEVYRVLRPDGTLWLNIGDSYATGGMGGGGLAESRRAWKSKAVLKGWRSAPEGFRHKEMIGIPWRVAFALQEIGWILRCDVIWHKPNPMPESIPDRPVKAHEYLFLLSKTPKYFYDGEAIREPLSGNAHARSSAASEYPGHNRGEGRRRPGVNPKAVGKNSREKVARDPAHANRNWQGARIKQNEDFSYAMRASTGYTTRNKRSVWTIGTFTYQGQHYATFPPDLVKPCVLAGTSAYGCCKRCGAPWQRILKIEPVSQENGASEQAEADLDDAQANGDPIPVLRDRKTIGWKPRCKCGEASVEPAIVLDPFGGSGTTGMVALENGRNAILIDLDPRNVPQIEARCNVTIGLNL